MILISIIHDISNTDFNAILFPYYDVLKCRLEIWNFSIFLWLNFPIKSYSVDPMLNLIKIKIYLKKSFRWRRFTIRDNSLIPRNCTLYYAIQAPDIQFN